MNVGVEVVHRRGETRSEVAVGASAHHDRDIANMESVCAKRIEIDVFRFNYFATPYMSFTSVAVVVGVIDVDVVNVVGEGITTVVVVVDVVVGLAGKPLRK